MSQVTGNPPDPAAGLMMSQIRRMDYTGIVNYSTGNFFLVEGGNDPGASRKIDEAGIPADVRPT